jgi:kinesin family protein 6/9
LTIKGLNKLVVNNEEEAFNLLFEGETNRTISEHQLNKESTRSHCIFTIYLEMKSRIESSEKVITSKLNFVDLAGSDGVKKTGSTGIILKEANYINKSLTFLVQVVVALTDKKKSRGKDHIPYRQSKLTHMLKDSIGGNCRTVMIATVWPEDSHLNETLSTLNFARRMMNVMNEASVNI